MRRRPMPDHLRTAVRREMDAAAEAGRAGDVPGRWRALERVHVLSQPWAWPHAMAHGRMLALAVRQRDRREAAGQVVRLLVAAPGSVSGRYPVGNTGRAGVGLREPMPVPEDLARLLAGPDL